MLQRIHICRRSKPDTEIHLWLLQEVLGTVVEQRANEEFQSYVSSLLFRYISAMSCEKMHRRLENVVSQRFFESLQRVESKRVPPPSGSYWARPFVGDIDEDHKEGGNDYSLMHEFVRITSKPGLHLLDVSIPNLSGIATKMKTIPENLGSLVIYNDETCQEFHDLLKELLGRLKSALEVLSNPGQRPVTKEFSSKFALSMLNAQLYGYALLKLSRGRAFRMHVENINHMLLIDSVTVDERMPVPMPMRKTGDVAKANKTKASYVESDEDDANKGEANEGGADEGEADNEDQKEADEELEAIEPTKRESCVHWLRLMVAHFDAVEIILFFVRSKNFAFRSIQTRILLAPVASTVLYPWQELLKHATYFPTPVSASMSTTPDSTSTTPDSTSTMPDSTSTTPESTSTKPESLTEFLERSSKTAYIDKMRSVWAKSVRDGWHECLRNPATKNTEGLRQVLGSLNTTAEENFKIMASNAITAFELWCATEDNAAKTQQQELTNTLMEIIYDKAYPTPEATDFYCSLRRLRFNGAIHCESCLASLVNNFPEDLSYRDQYDSYFESSMLTEMKVVSILFPICLLLNPRFICYDNSGMTG